jgi:hypothetical protein
MAWINRYDEDFFQAFNKFSEGVYYAEHDTYYDGVEYVVIRVNNLDRVVNKAVLFQFYKDEFNRIDVRKRFISKIDDMKKRPYSNSLNVVFDEFIDFIRGFIPLTRTDVITNILHDL